MLPPASGRQIATASKALSFKGTPAFIAFSKAIVLESFGERAACHAMGLLHDCDRPQRPKFLIEGCTTAPAAEADIKRRGTL